VRTVRRALLWVALAVVLVTLVGSVALVLGQTRQARVPGGLMMRGGPAMMRGGTGAAPGMVWLAGDGNVVPSIAAARSRAAQAAAGPGLHPGEVIWFDNGFYVELKDSAGHPATEVIVDPAAGTVSLEPGPAMMWNTRYGMHGGPAGGVQTATVTPGQAVRIASAWLAANLPGHLAATPDAYPGYYTLETTSSDGTVNGMLSVNATTGALWYHHWHGRFIARQDT